MALHKLKRYLDGVLDSQIEELCRTINAHTQSTRQAAPASAAAAGAVGDIRYDSSYIYVCVETNTWVRSALVAW